MSQTNFIYIFLYRSYNMCDPCILRGDPVIFFEGYHPTKKKHIKFEKHYVGNLGAIIEDAMNEGLITEQSQIKCTVPDSLPHFERDNVMFTWRSDLSEDERKMVEDAFSARVFYH